jgi:hypothetical protein
MLKSTLALSLILSLTIFSGCGGNPANIVPATTPIAASQVFSNIAETWTFQNGYGDISTIDVMPQADGSTVWHYLKNADRAYWMPDGKSAEIYFFLERDAAGTWYSTGGHIIAPFGFPWDSTHVPQDVTYLVPTDPGHPRPYLILGDSGVGVSTVFPDAGVLDNPWITEMYVQDGFLVSEQWEGACPNQTHEKWWFKPGRGLWKVEPLTQGNCFEPTDPQLAMTRIQP